MSLEKEDQPPPYDKNAMHIVGGGRSYNKIFDDSRNRRCSVQNGSEITPTIVSMLLIYVVYVGGLTYLFRSK